MGSDGEAVHPPLYTANVVRAEDEVVIESFPASSKEAALGRALDYIEEYGYEEVDCRA